MSGLPTLRQIGPGKNDAAAGEHHAVEGKQYLEIVFAVKTSHVPWPETKGPEPCRYSGGHLFKFFVRVALARRIVNLDSVRKITYRGETLSKKP